MGRESDRASQGIRRLRSDPASCDFCAIARGGDPSAEVVGEGEDWVAFFPLAPATRGHTLIIPRHHVEDLWAAPPPTGSALIEAAIEVGHAIEAALQPHGLNLITSAGAAAEQTVAHLHLHIVPRWDDDGFGRIWPSKASMRPDLKRDLAARIRAAYQAGGRRAQDEASPMSRQRDVDTRSKRARSQVIQQLRLRLRVASSPQQSIPRFPRPCPRKSPQ